MAETYNVNPENSPVTNVTLNADDKMYVSNGGTANYTAVNYGGDLYVSSGGSANYTAVNYGGDLYVSSGGKANYTTVNSGGVLYVSSGGSANKITVNSAGYLDVLSGGTATGIAWTPCVGRVIVRDGAYATFTSAYVGVYYGSSNTLLSSAFEMNGKTLDASGQMYVMNGGVASKTKINKTGTLRIWYGGLATSTTVNSSSYLYVSSGGSAKDATVNGGRLSVFSGGTAAIVTIASGGSLIVSPGGTADSVTVSSGSLTVYKDGMLVSATVKNGVMHVLGSANSTTARGSGILEVQAGGVATDTLVNSGGSAIISGSAVKTTVNKMGVDLAASLTVFNGGKTTSTTINSMGFMHISNGGRATSTTVDYGGLLYVSNGGQATSSLVKEGGLIEVFNGGFASNTVIDGTMYVSNGGTAKTIDVKTNGNLYLFDGAEATGKLSIADGALVSAYEGSVIDFDISGISPANEALVNNLSLVKGKPTYTLTVSGVQANGTYILAGGAADFGGTITVKHTLGTELGTLTVDGGALYIGSAKYTLAQAVGNKLAVTVEQFEADLTGDLNTQFDLTAGMSAVNVNIIENGKLNVLEGGKADHTTVNSGGDLEVFSGGAATGVNVNSGGWLRVSSGGTATGIAWQPCTGDVYVEDGGSATFVSSYSGVYYGEYGKLVESAATMYGETIDTSSYEMYVMDGGLAKDTDVEYWGNVFVWSGGTASDTEVRDNGCLLVSSGGTASDTTVRNDGVLKVFTGGTARDTNVEAFGELHIFTNAVATGRMTFEADAVVSAHDGSVFDFDISTVGPENAALVNDLSLVKGKPDYTLTVGAAFQPDGMYTLAGGATGFHAPITVTDTLGTVLGTLTVGGGETDIGELKYALALDGSELTVTISGGGTVITGDIAGETKNVYKGWTAQDVNINAGGALVVSNGGTANNTTVNSKGMLTVQSGGTAEVVTVNPGGDLEILNGGAAYQIRENGGHVFIGGKGSATFVPNAFTGLALESWGRATVHSGTTATDVSVASGGNLYVYAGGSATGIVAEDGAYLTMIVATDTYAQGAYAGSAFEIGSSVTGVTLRPRFELEIGSGGTAVEIGIGSGLHLDVSSGGTAVDVTVEHGGHFTIYSGGTARNVVENGGYVILSDGADVTFASHTINGLVFSTVATIHSGTTATHATVKTGPVFVYGGGIVSDTAVEDSLYLEGGVATDTTVNNKGRFYINSGVATGTTVNSGGSFCVYSAHNTASDTTVNDGGYFIVTPGNTANDVVVSSGGSLSLAGGRLTGKAVFETGAIVTPSGATVDFDLTRTTPGADPLVNDLSFVMDPSTTYTLTVDGTEATGTYNLAGNVATFGKYITLMDVSGEDYGYLTIGGTVSNKYAYYTLAISDSKLTVDIVSKAASDTTPPTVSNITASTTAPTNTSVLVTADFNDDVALKSKLYRIDDGAWTDYVDGVVVTENATVYFKAVDTSGNECKPKFITIDNIDKVAPTITNITPSTTAPAASVTVTANFADNAGLISRRYKIGDGGWTDYVDGVTVTENTTVSFYALDAAGNDATASYTVTNIDTSSPDITPPTITVTPSTTKPATSVTVSAVFSDNVAVATKQYRVGDGDWKDYTDPVPVTENLTVGFRATDTSGNATVENYMVTNIENEPQNDWLYNKKTKTWNDAENIVTFSVNEVTVGDSMVYLDKKGSVESEDGKYFNSVGRTQTETGTAEDAADYAKIELAYGAELKFSVDSTVGGTFYVYQATTDKKGDLVAAQRQKIAVKADKTSPAKLSAIYLEAGEYFVGMEAKLPAAKKNPEVAAYYNVTLAGTKFYVDADEGTNNTADGGGTVSLGRGKSGSFVLDTTAMTGSTKFENYVGFGDGADFAKLDLASGAYMSFHVTGEGDGKAKFTVWKQDASGKLSKVANVSLPAKKAYDATTKAQFLDPDKYTYYVSMECTDAAKGKSVYYNVEVADGAVFFDSADDGRNDVLYDKKAKEFYKEDAYHHFESTTVGVGTKSVRLDSAPVGEPGYDNFVGYGDAADYAKIELTGGGKLSFTIEAAGDATFTFYRKGEKKGVETLEAVQSVKLAVAKGETTVAQTMDVSTVLEAGEYYVSMEAKNTKPTDKGSVFYNVTATLSLPDASALDMPMAAASYAESMQDKLFGESGNGILASLA